MNRKRSTICVAFALLPVLFTLVMFVTADVSAASASGTWTSNISGKGYVQTSRILDTNSDVKLVLTQNGNSVSGTIVTTCTYSQLHAGFENWGSPAIGSKNTNTVTGTLSGSVLTLICYTPASSGVSNGISWTSPAYTVTWTLAVNGDKITGSGTYTAAGITYTYTFNLKSGSGSVLSLDLNNSTMLIPATAAIGGGALCLVASLLPVPKGAVRSTRSMGNNTRYEPSDQRVTDGGTSPPPELMYMGGAGLSVPPEYVNGVPVRPRQWQSQQHGPVCPVHGTMCNASFKGVSDPGTWVCPKCQAQRQGNPPGSGFPWGP